MPQGSFQPRNPRRPGLRRLLALLWATAWLGCAAVEHSFSASDFSGEALSTRSSRGAARLRDEARFDKSIAAYIAEHGRPDFLYLVDRQKLYLFYVSTDQAAKFDRVLMEASEVHELGRIPGSLMKLLPADARRTLDTQRARAQRQAQTRARHTRAQQARRGPQRAGPGARAPGGTYLGGFEVDQVVKRMREPVTAADAGVAGWQQTRSRNGSTAWSAQAGRTRYEVSGSRVAVTTPISTTRGRLPGSARIAIQRINNAIFATRSEAVSKVALDLAERAAADRSGRTQFQKRVAGRTLRIGRLADRGVFAYSVHP